jgi:anion-transporting  ArsA/GET3 family ATPase
VSHGTPSAEGAAVRASEGAAARDTLLSILDRHKLVVCVGSGGVGKTTTAAALAIAAARRGKKAAVLTIDPARRLAQALGVEKMGNEPRALAADLTAPGSVDAMMLEAGEALDDFVDRLVPDPERRKRLHDNRLYQVIARHLGGTHEYMAVERLHGLVAEGGYDLVVLDTPPTVNALDFLDAPNRLAGFFSEKITRYFVRQTEEKKGGIFQRLKDRAGDIAMQVLGKALGEGFVEELADFSTAFQGLFTAIHDRAVAANEILRADSTAFLIVSAADPVRTAEAAEFLRTLERLGIKPRVIVANRVHVAIPSRPAVDATSVGIAVNRLKADGVAVDDAEAVLGSLSRAERLLQALRQRDARGLNHLRRLLGGDHVVVVPELDREVQDRAAVEHLLGTIGLAGPQRD